MIESAEEFKRLRESENSEEYSRASHEEAKIEVWEEVLNVYPNMAFWVAQNKTVPFEMLLKLATNNDSKVRSMVASKRKIPESLMVSLAQDKDESVRHALANNGKVTKRVLETLSNDSWQVVREVALQKMQALTRPSN